MGEIFERPLPSVSLPFTGERLTSEFGGQTEIEHLHRYFLARHLCRDRHVLDIASGEGYGSAFLAQVAAGVVGVEVSADVVAHATANYQRDNLNFRVGDARQIPIDDSSVDVIVSFETIEHFAGHDRFLAEIKRVLRSDGLLVISTPDRDTYSPADQAANPFHALELTRSEFAALLQDSFSHVAIWWQRPMIGSTILPGPETPAGPGALCFERRGDRHFEGSSGYPRPLYLLALCSDKPLPELPPSVYINATFVDNHDAMIRDLCTIREQAASLHEALRQREETLRERDETLRQREETLRERDEALRQRDETLRQRAEEAEQLRHDVAAMRASTSWRLTSPVRAVAKLLRHVQGKKAG